jgi:hypothetical protein
MQVAQATSALPQGCLDGREGPRTGRAWRWIRPGFWTQNMVQATQEAFSVPSQLPYTPKP